LRVPSYAVPRMTLVDPPRQNIAMNNHTHTLVWLDHRLAKVFHFDSKSSDLAVVHSSHPHAHLHHKANAGDSGHVAIDRHFLDSIATAMSHNGPVLIVGPGTAKKELHSHLLDRHPDISARISAVTSLDHPSDGELLACGRRFFDADDRMHAQQAP
jgi:stalled ribosome rescue protein Dom34